jgi:hypothetical protein
LYELSTDSQKWSIREIPQIIISQVASLVHCYVFLPNQLMKITSDGLKLGGNDEVMLDYAMYRVLRNAFSFLRRIVMIGLVESWTPLFSPNLDTRIEQNGIPSLGILISCQAICMANFRKIIIAEEKNSHSKVRQVTISIILIWN